MVYNDYAESQEEFEHVILIISVFSGGFIALITLICVANMLNTISTSMVLRQREFAMLQSVDMTPKASGRWSALRACSTPENAAVLAYRSALS